MNRALRVIVATGRPAFTPRALFAPGIGGGWYDPSDLTSMFSDSAMTTPATVDGVVGAIRDKSGNGNHLVQTGADSLKPVLKQAGGLYWLEFDGTDDFLRTSADVDMSGADASTVAAAALTEGTSVGALFEPGGLVQRTMSLRAPMGGNSRYGFLSIANAANNGAASDVYSFPHLAVLVGHARIADDYQVIRINGVLSGSGSEDQGTGAYGSRAFFVGARSGTGSYFDGRVFGLVARLASSTDAEIRQTETWLAGKAGLVIG